MTTNIGVKAFDPDSRRNYILLIGDSEGSWEDDGLERFAYNLKKIHINKGKNFMFAYAGETYNFRKEYKSILKSKKIIESQDLIQTFLKIRKQGFKKNTYICAQNQKGTLSLFSLVGNFLVGVEYLCNGSGREFVQDSMNEIWNFSKWINGKKVIVCPWTESIPFCFRVLQKASGKNKDKYTGGHMDIGIMTSKGSSIYRNFASLSKCNAHDVKEKIRKEKKNLEKIFSN